MNINPKNTYFLSEWEIIETKGVSCDFSYICEVVLLHFNKPTFILSPMKHFILVLFAAVLFSSLTSSCAKKTDDNTTMDMAKPDSIGGGGPAPTISVAIAPNRITGNYKGVMVSGAGSAPSTTATFTATNSAGNNLFNYAAYYGPNTTAEGTANSGTSGVSSWSQGPDSPLPQNWYPLYQGVSPTQPTSWTGYDNVTVSGTTVTCTSTAFPAANITIQVVGGGGGPH